MIRFAHVCSLLDDAVIEGLRVHDMEVVKERRSMVGWPARKHLHEEQVEVAPLLRPPSLLPLRAYSSKLLRISHSSSPGTPRKHQHLQEYELLHPNHT